MQALLIQAAANFQDLKADIWAGLTLLLVLAVTFAFRKLYDYMMEKISVLWLRKPGLAPAASSRHRQIMDLILEMRLHFKCSRVCVWQFHNGETFMMADHSWKLSCSYESVAPGRSYINRESQGLLVTNMVDIVEPIVTGVVGDFDATGVELVSACVADGHLKACDPGKCRLGLKGHRILHFDVARMPASMAKYTLESQVDTDGHMYVINLLSHTGDTIGFIGVQFIMLDADQQVLAGQILCSGCDRADKITHLLTSRDRV